MLDLQSKRWRELSHAYGPAKDIPELLQRLAPLSAISDYETEPYFSLWSSLCHQGDVYSASYAAVPHLISIKTLDGSSSTVSILQLVICIEIARLSKRGPSIPSDIQGSYFKSLSKLTMLIAKLHRQHPTKELTILGAAAFAINSKQPQLAESYLELSPEIAPAFLEWFFER